jgi:hypothetical protein
MAIEEYTINWSSLNNISPPDLTNITNATAQEVINNIPATANNLTNNYYGIIVLTALGIFLYWVLSDKTQYSYFKYSEIRAIGISLGIINTFGIVMLSIGHITNIIHISTLFTLYMLSLGYTIIKNPS